MDMLPAKNPNPQGKGDNQTVGILNGLLNSIELPERKYDSHKRLVEDYLSSLLVLSCDFSFKPVVGKSYSIYMHHGRLLLSLVGADEGGTSIYDDYIGKCTMNPDFSWNIKDCHQPVHLLRLRQELEETNSLLSTSVGDKRGTSLLQPIIDKQMRAKQTSSLGYYQRVFSFLLGKSMTNRNSRLLLSNQK